MIVGGPNEIPKNPLETAEWFIERDELEKAKIVLDLVKPYAKIIEELNLLGQLYGKTKDWNDVLEIALKIQDLMPENVSKYDVRANIIKALIQLNRPIEALEYILINDIEKPNDSRSQLDKSMVYFLLNQKDKAKEILLDIKNLPRSKHIDNSVDFNLGTYYLQDGKFKEGLSRFLLGGKFLNIRKEYYLNNTPWDGKTYPGKTIVLVVDAGIGDEIVNIRFQKEICNRGMNCVWYTDRKDLAEVYRHNGFSVITSIKEIQPDWLWLMGMEAPVLLDLDYKDLWHGPYLKAKGTTDKLPGKFKIGLKYSGNLKYDQDLHRTIPNDLMVNCIPENATLYSFQVYDDIEFTSDRVIPLRDKIKTWDDTLNYLDQMDLVVSSCTSLPHAASAMGKETIVMVPILNYYTWAYKHSKHSAWYGKSTTILRQQEYDNWNAPLDELKLLLNAKNI
jgi:tetratricopeptide (TPR) repeat protein